jgi:hypothetical protein
VEILAKQLHGKPARGDDDVPQDAQGNNNERRGEKLFSIVVQGMGANGRIAANVHGCRSKESDGEFCVREVFGNVT